LTATYRQWLEALKNIVAQRPLEERRKLFHDNAMRFYGLK
jgi:predicted TIM-barrel fold metal-dependent hydrolase